MYLEIKVVTFIAVMLSLQLQLSCKPLPLSEDTSASFNNTIRERRSWARRRRSIPEIDAVYPEAIEARYRWEAERDAEEEAPADQPPALPFNADDIGSLINFGGRKGMPARHGQQRPASPGAPNSAAGGRLPADEQLDCYRQQNIDPPGPAAVGGAAGVGRLWGAPSVADAARTRQSIVDRARPRENSGDVFSLYSDPQRDGRLRNSKDWRVYRPVGVRPEFPMYDDDVDVHMMDPLQGILDDKYWLDPEVREATVRRYIDLAASNMMPPEEQMPVVKRDAQKDSEKKSGKSAIKGADRQCPCQEVVVACGSCSKDKGKKSNSTGDDVADEGISYGRKLLGLVESDSEDQEETDERYVPEQFWDSQIDEGAPRYVGRRLLSFDEDEEDEYGDEAKGLPRIKDSIRPLSNYSENHEESNENADDNYENNLQSEFDGGVASREENRIMMNKAYFERDDSQGSLKENKHKKLYPDYSMNDSSTLIEPGENLQQEQNAIHDYGDEANPGYYKPNKIANAIQNTLQQKAKPTKGTTTINSKMEFQKVNDELFANISLYKNTESLESTTASVISLDTTTRTSRTVSKAPQSNADVSHLSAEEKFQPNKKRSPPFVSLNEDIGSPNELFDQIAHVDGDAPLFQSDQAQDAGGAANKNATAPATGPTTAKGPQTSAETKYTVSSVSPSLYITDTSTRSTTTAAAAGAGKKGDEEAVDAEIANDIVDSVVAESQRGSVLGHQLGVCRRNESKANIRYGRVVPEMETVIKTVTGCIMDKLKSQLAAQSCVLLETELSDFLKWTVLGGEQYKDYVQKIGEFSFLPTVPPTANPKCQEPLAAMEAEGDAAAPEPMPPNPKMFAEQPVQHLK